MKKKVCIGLLIIFLLFGLTNQVFAGHIENLDIPIFHNDEWGTSGKGDVGTKFYQFKKDISTNKSVKDSNGKFIELEANDFILDILKQQYGYTGEIKSEILIETNITITSTPLEIFGNKIGDKYDVYIGKDYKKDKSKFGGVIKNLKLDELKSKLGYSGKDPKKGTQWKVKIKVKCPTEFRYGQYTIQNDGNYHVNVDLTGVELWSKPDMDSIGEEVLNNATDVTFESTKLEEDLIEDAKDFVLDKISELFGKLFMLLLDFFRTIPDAIQMGINTIVKIDTVEEQKVNAEPDEITVPVKTIQADSKKNERAQLTTGDKNKGDSDKQLIKGVDAKSANLTKETEIPTIPLDMYNIVYGKIDFLDVNFFNVDTSKHQEGTYWMFLRKVFSAALHIMIYLSIAFLIITLIIHGIMMVKNTMIPEKKKEQLDGLKHFVLALIMLVGSVLIMNLCIYGVNFFTSYFGNEEVGDAFIRVNVSGGDTDFSFNANFTEFTRFMTQINTVEKINEKLMYIAMYAFLVFANFVTLMTMIARSIMIIILSVQGPIIATAYSIDKKVFNMSYSDWVKKYFKWTSVQLVLMLGYRLIITLGRL